MSKVVARSGPKLFGRVLRKFALCISILFVVSFAWISIRIIAQSRRDEARPADAIVVFGAAEYAGKPSPVFRARLDHAYNLYTRKLAPLIITTGGAAWDPKYTEGGVGRDYLAAKGIADIHMIAETQSDNTAESAERVAKILQVNGLHSCIAVSDPYHLYRVKRMMEGQDITTYASPRPQPPRGEKKRVANIARETLSYMAWKLHIRTAL